MILTLGQKQLAAVKAVAEERHAPYLRREEYLAKNQHAVNMPAAAWRALVDPLADRAFTERGEWSSKHEGAGAALRAIIANLEALQAHPAYRRRALVDDSERRHKMVVGFEGRGGAFLPYPDYSTRLYVFEPREVMLSVDLGSGPVQVEGVEWEMRDPRPSDEIAGLFVQVFEHEGWSGAPRRAER